MLGSLLLTFAISAAVLAASAYIGLLRVRRHAHVAERDASTRRLRFLVAAGVAGVGGFGIAALLSGGLVVASATAVGLAGSVLLAARLGDTSWTVRGLVVWALVVVAAAGFTAWLLASLLTSDLTYSQLTVGSTAWLLMTLGMLRVRRPAHDRIGDLSRRVASVPEVDESQDRRLLVTLGAILSSGVVATTVVSLGAGPAVEGPASLVRETDSPDRSNPTSGEPSATTVTPPPSSTPSRPTASSTAATADDGQSTREPTRSGTATTAPSTTSGPTSGPTKTQKARGYEKKKPNRPSDVPTPGQGRTKLP